MRLPGQEDFDFEVPMVIVMGARMRCSGETWCRDSELLAAFLALEMMGFV
jgi:hypothetical protein